jgi:LacI family transcriptional regulator
VAVFVTSLGKNGADEQGRVEALLGRQLTGLIATPVSTDQSYLTPWQDRTAIVFIDRPPSKITADSVVEDDRGGAYAATTHLIEHGHRRVGFMGDSVGTATTARRLKGYRAALADAGIVADERNIVLGPSTEMDAGTAVVELLAQPEPPTALFSSNAWNTIGIIPALQAIGRSDLPLISFGDFPLAAAVQPPLTVIDQDPTSVGRIAATRLFERLDHPHRRLKRKIVLPVPLITRGSCRTGPMPAEPVPTESLSAGACELVAG